MRNTFVGFVVATSFVCSVTLAQNAPAQQQAHTADQEIAACIYGVCHNEVEISKFAQTKLQSQEAKDFADRMIKDHTPDCEAYQKLAGNLVSARIAAAPRGAVGGVDWVSIHQELGQQCLKTAKEEISKQPSGAEFDKCFMGHQLGAHLQTMDKLKVLREHASPQLQQQIDKSLEGVQKHTQLARQIVDQLKDRPSERVSRKTDSK